MLDALRLYRRYIAISIRSQMQYRASSVMLAAGFFSLICLDFAALAILDRTDPLGSAVWVQWLSPLAGLAFMLIALRIWNLDVRNYRSTGS